jgi:hypothetical protein
MISVVCVTNRKGAAQFLKEQLDKQTFTDYEAIVADDSSDARIKVWKHFTPRQKQKGDVWNLNKAYNDCLNLAEGELTVFLQDFIWIPANGLERFWETYQIYPDALVTGVGHKAKSGIKGISETDFRMNAGPGLHAGNPSLYELNWSSCPSRLLKPFREEMDACYAGSEKVWAKDIGADVWIDGSNVSIGLSQEECGGRPADWEQNHFLKSNFTHLV